MLHIKNSLPNTIVLKFLISSLCICFLGACNGNEENNDSEEEQMSLTAAETMLKLVNEARLNAGLNTIILNEVLNDTAYEHSLDMDNNNYFSHTGLDGSTFSERVINAAYTGIPIGENIARGQRTVEAAFTSWINSDGHKANILNTNATEMGLGLSGTYWTQIFGRENAN